MNWSHTHMILTRGYHSRTVSSMRMIYSMSLLKHIFRSRVMPMLWPRRSSYRQMKHGDMDTRELIYAYLQPTQVNVPLKYVTAATT